MKTQALEIIEKVKEIRNSIFLILNQIEETKLEENDSYLITADFQLKNMIKNLEFKNGLNPYLNNGFNHVFFESTFGQKYIWNQKLGRFESFDSIDFVDKNPYYFYEQNRITEYIIEIFNQEGCKCNGKGLQVGFYEFISE